MNFSLTLSHHYAAGTFHHAYVCVGARDELIPEIRAVLTEHLGFPVQGNPDYMEATYELFGIDEGRRLKETAAQAPFSYDKKIHVVAVESMSTEAQNALLKLFEEPTPHAHFFLVVPHEDILLPTLRSRVHVLTIPRRGVNAERKDARVFLKGGVKERMKIIAPLVAEKNKAGAYAFLEEIEARLHENGGREGALKELLIFKGYLTDRSPSVKMILEHVVGVIPRI